MDEDRWVVPAAWWRQVDPFRGRSPERPVALDETAGQTVAELLAIAGNAVGDVLRDARSDPELARWGERYLGVRSGLLRRAQVEPQPLGAAVVGALLAWTTNWQRHEGLTAVADHWVATHGPGFAAEAGALLAVVGVSTPGRPYHAPYGDAVERVIGRVAADEVGRFHAIARILRRLRTLLAATDAAGYDEAVDRVAQHRPSALRVRVAASYLLPTEQGWLDEVVAQVRSLGVANMGDLAMLLGSATTLDQATALCEAAGYWGVIHMAGAGADAGALQSVASLVGPEAAPLLAAVYDADLSAGSKKRAVAILSQLPTDQAFDVLLDRVDRRYVQPAVLEAMARFPRRALRLLAGAAAAGAGSGGSAAGSASITTVKDLLRVHTISHPEVVGEMATQLDPAAAAVVEAVVAASPVVPVAADDELPPILVTPPWTGRRKRTAPIVIDGLASGSPVTLAWLPGEQQQWATCDPERGRWLVRQQSDWPRVVKDAVDGSRWSWREITVLAFAPDELVRPHLRDFVPASTWEAETSLQRLLGRFGDEAIAFVLRVVRLHPTTLAPVLMPLVGSDVARQMADWLARSKTVRPLARRWFERHPAAAARDLVPVALVKPGKDRSAAEAALRMLAQGGHSEAVLAAAEAHRPEARAAIEAALAADPLQLLPARIPARPAWLDPAHLPQVLLPDRRHAVPAEAVGHICTMLALSKPGETYAGLDVVRAAVDPVSLAEMAWGVFERWRMAGFPAKDGWVLDALGLVGDDDTVRRLAPLIRAWPGESAHKRAVNGLDVLAAIGTDVALMHLHGVAQKAKFRGLKDNARTRIDEVAENLGLTPDQLADRLVPDFGLDHDGALVLDYGDRRFRVGFDEQLKPTIADEDGARRKTLPKPGAKDDPTLAPAAYARFGGLKKDVRTVAADQIRRFEQAMVTGRRWTVAEQRSLFVEHPLLWHLARRLVWATFDAAGRADGSFRVAEDRTLADPSDEELTLPDNTVVGIAHPLHLGGTVEVWSDLFADYEVLQPFPQLAREVLALTEPERGARLLDRFAGTKVPTGKVLGLSSRGWVRGEPQDAGIQGVTYKPVPRERSVVVDLDPGIAVGEPMAFDEQTVVAVWLSGAPSVDWGTRDGDRVFGELDPITASEALRDLEALVS